MGCSPSAPLVEADSATVRTPRCSEELFLDAASRRPESICGPRAHCEDYQLAPSLGLSTPTCSCRDPLYILPDGVQGASQIPIGASYLSFRSSEKS
eukprot:5878653-Prymnesium_polylepis.1